MTAPVTAEPQHQPRRAARLGAVQAIYQMELTGLDADDVVEEFLAHRFGHDELRALGDPDEDFFGDLVRGVPKHQDEIDRAIVKSLASDWKLSRVDSILRAILRTAVYEFVSRRDVPVKVVIDQYVDIAHAFFEGDEPAFVNAALDKIGRRKRAVEFGETPPDDELQF
ncbi:MAG TPA: transcription antitermination factor NusB [Rhizomicrobium sp.]|nr:transcription antitermination factor NusB [Rhizomicrobium sp.]